VQSKSVSAGGEVVTATEFVRHFASYARHASDAPVHILNHGKRAWSLVTADLFERLSRSPEGQTDQEQLKAKLDIVLDVVPTTIILLDHDLRILRVNAAARSAFQRSNDDFQGLRLTDIMNDPRDEYIIRAAMRVHESGIIEDFETDSTTGRQKTFRLRISPFPNGLAIFGDDITLSRARSRGEAFQRALEDVIDLHPGMARGTINWRGNVAAVSPALAHMVQTDPSRMIGLRFESIFDVASRGRIAELTESIFSRRTSFVLSAGLLTMDNRAIPVEVSMSPCRDSDATGAIFLIMRAGETPAAQSGAARRGSSADALRRSP
jgi:PAS domain-containing protein